MLLKIALFHPFSCLSNIPLCVYICVCVCIYIYIDGYGYIGEGHGNPLSLAFPGGSAGKESACDAGDLGSIPGLGRSPGEGKGYPVQYCGLENSMDYMVHGVAESQTRLSTFTFTFI